VHFVIPVMSFDNETKPGGDMVIFTILLLLFETPFCYVRYCEMA